MRHNSFFANSLAASLLKEFRKGNVNCGNCSAENRLFKYCKECMEYLCEACVHYHENTKLTRAHNLMPLDKFEEDLIFHGENRAVFCPAHEDNIVEQYCQSCEEAICRGCEVHQEHNPVSVAEGCSIEVPELEAVLERAISKVSESCFLIFSSLSTTLQLLISSFHDRAPLVNSYRGLLCLRELRRSPRR